MSDRGKIINADQLYDAIKEALTAFDLHWSQKSEMGVKISEDTIEFSYQFAKYVITVKEED